MAWAGMDLDRQAYWEGAGAEKSFAHPLRLDWLSARVDPQARILDYGCGYGRALLLLRDAGFANTLGVDGSGAMIARGRRDHPELHLKHGASPLPEPDASFDAILLVAVLTCVVADAEQKALMNDLKRLLAPGGLIFLSDYPLQTDPKSLERYARGAARYGTWGVHQNDEGGVFRHHGPGRLHALLAGLEIEQEAEVDTVTLSGRPARAVQMLARRPA